MDDDYAAYDDLMQMMDDRDDSNDPEFRDPDGYCEHGAYVGGCGTDWMCHWCEAGISLAEARRIVAAERTARIRKHADNAARLLNGLLTHGMGGIDAAALAQESSYVANPPSRYGRH